MKPIWVWILPPLLTGDVASVKVLISNKRWFPYLKRGLETHHHKIIVMIKLYKLPSPLAGTYQTLKNV